MAKKKQAIRHRNKKGQFSKRGKKERVLTHAKAILRRIAKRDRAKAKELAKRSKEAPPPPETRQVFEWVVNFSYEGSGRSFDVITTGRDEAEAYNTAIKFLRDDVDAQRIIRANLRGWTPSIVKARKTDEEAGEAEYRNDSQA